MAAIILSLRVMAFSLLLLTAFQVISASSHRRFNISYLVLTGCMLVYLLTPYFFNWPGAGFSIPVGFVLGVIFDGIASATPAIFLIVTLIVFQEKLPPKWLAALMLLMVALDAIQFSCDTLICGSQSGWIMDTPQTDFLFNQFPHILRIAFVFLSLLWTFDGWREDLVDFRRRFRLIFLINQGLLIVTVVLLENFVSPELLAPEHVLLISSVLVSIVAILFASFFLQVKPQINEQLTATPGIPALLELTTLMSNPKIQQLTDLMKNQYLYKKDELTIGLLAKHMDIPEYKLRTLINQELGYRNFNQLLNTFRIKEASYLLLDDDSKHLPIISIALEVGYRSLSTFNKAFKEQHGMTPSDYRKKPA